MGAPETMPSSDFSSDNGNTTITRIEAVVVGRSEETLLLEINYNVYFGGIGDTASILTDCCSHGQ